MGLPVCKQLSFTVFEYMFCNSAPGFLGVFVVFCCVGFFLFLETYCVRDFSYLIFKRQLGRLVSGLLWRLKGKENGLSALESHLPAGGGNA